MQAVVLETEFVISLGRRATEAAAAGAPTFPVPEFAAIAATIARDRRVAPARAAARRWRTEGASYHALVRLCASYVMGIEDIVPASEPMYVPKARGELEPLLALWPHVLGLPTRSSVSVRDLLRLRAFPVHPLGVTGGPAWADGRRCSPAEYFFHDVDHARFKVREDLRAIGVAIPDAYQDGTTFDSATGRHRSILPEAYGKLGPSLWTTAAVRLSLIENVLAQIERLLDRSQAKAAEWLLFQMLHEKGLALDVQILRLELATSRHVELLRTKVSHGFYGEHTPPSDVMAKMDAARDWLTKVLS